MTNNFFLNNGVLTHDKGHIKTAVICHVNVFIKKINMINIFCQTDLQQYVISESHFNVCQHLL